MSLDYLILPEARDDIDDAYTWYESKTAGRGDAFLTELYDTISDLRVAPERYGFVLEPLRAAPLSGSKFVVYYTVEVEQVKIVGVIHANANPQKWRDRI